MFAHPATQANLALLQARGAQVIGPEEGRLASGMVARGHMSEPPAILGQVRYLLARAGPLQGRKVVVTAGGTREPLDPVRYLTNHSSGKQGYALADAYQEAWDRGTSWREGIQFGLQMMPDTGREALAAALGVPMDKLGKE